MGAPVWFQWESRALHLPGDAGGASVRRLAAGPRCAVEIVEYDNPGGVLRHLGMRGRATVEPMDPALFRRLLARYLGPDEGAWNPWFVEHVARIDDPAGRLIRLVPESVFTNDVSFFRTGPALARGGATPIPCAQSCRDAHPGATSTACGRPACQRAPSRH